MLRRLQGARRLTIILAACLIGTATVAGCGDGTGLGKRYPVSGTVNYNGKPLAKGEISFRPEDVANGHAASGVIEDGSYTLSTAGDRDGALPGKYKVTVVSKEVDFSKAEAQFKGSAKGRQDLPFLPKDYQVKAAKTAKNNVPAKYNTPESSKLTAEVKEQSNSIPFDLTD